MRRFTVLAAVVVAALAVVGTAQAGNPDGLGPWADYVVANNQGCAFNPPDMTTCVPVPANRSDPQAAVGPAESPAGPNQNIPVGSFYSMGFTDQSTGTAFITLGFDNPICNQPGMDLSIDIFEITQEPYPNETVDVYVSKDNVTYVFAGTVSKDGTVGMPASVPIANFVKLVDATPRAPFVVTTIVADGYDVDGVRAFNTGCQPGNGKVEICKASTNGMTGKLFQYSINGGAAISVRGGRCSGPITTLAGAVRIVELPSDPPSDLVKVTTRPSNRLVLTDLPNRTAIVYVVPGSTAANETMVTFTNQPAGGNYGDAQDLQADRDSCVPGPRLQLHASTAAPLITTEANDAFADPSTWSCRLAGQLPGRHEADGARADPGGRRDRMDRHRSGRPPARPRHRSRDGTGADRRRRDDAARRQRADPAAAGRLHRGLQGRGTRRVHPGRLAAAAAAAPPRSGSEGSLHLHRDAGGRQLLRRPGRRRPVHRADPGSQPASPP